VGLPRNIVSPAIDPHGCPTVHPGTVPGPRSGIVVVVVVVVELVAVIAGSVVVVVGAVVVVVSAGSAASHELHEVKTTITTIRSA